MTVGEPWAADRPFDAEGAKRAIQSALPELGSVDARLLGSGWDFDAFEVNQQWVFRFPARKSGGEGKGVDLGGRRSTEKKTEVVA